MKFKFQRRSLATPGKSKILLERIRAVFKFTVLGMQFTVPGNMGLMAKYMLGGRVLKRTYTLGVLPVARFRAFTIVRILFTAFNAQKWSESFLSVREGCRPCIVRCLLTFAWLGFPIKT